MLRGEIFGGADAGLVIFAVAVVPDRFTGRADGFDSVADAGAGGEGAEIDMPDILFAKEAGFFHRKMRPGRVGGGIGGEENIGGTGGAGGGGEGGDPELGPGSAFAVCGPVVGVFDDQETLRLRILF